MMKRILLLLSIIMLFVAGCSTEQAEPKDQLSDIDKEVKTPAQQPQASVQDNEEAVVAEPSQPAPAETAEPESSGYDFESLPLDQQRKIKFIRGLMDEARDREENYFFRYSAPGIAQTDVWVKGNLMKRSIIRETQVDKFHTYNMVYLNSETKTAQGYCETTKATCPNGKGPFPETYSKWVIKTPKKWLMELDDEFTWTLDNKISDTLYHIIDYNSDGKTTRVYINNYKGWPARVQIYPMPKVDSLVQPSQMTSEYLYDDMDIGGVSDDDVTPN